MTRMTPALARLLVADHRGRPKQEKGSTPEPPEPTATVRIPRQRRGGGRHRRNGVRSPKS